MQEEAGEEDGASRLAVRYQELGLGRLTRKVSQRRRGSLANHLRSIYLDAHFVHSVVASYRRQTTEEQPSAGAPLSFAVFANLRNGAWYLLPKAWDGRVYFKSTDGHSGHWDFSRTRLNLHLALEAARRGGAIVVDSTRRGKAYPDALTYTLPIWAAVLNRFLARDEDEVGPEQQHLYLPPWVPPSERDRILARLPGLCAKLEAALGTTDGAAFREELLAAFREGGASPKPFRPVWIKHGDPLWLLPGVGLGPDEGGCAGGRPTPLDFIPIVCVSASRDREPAEHREHFSWPYVQGAGDDHENWASFDRPPSSSAKGGPLLLTPGLFWAHVRAILPWTTAALPLPWDEEEEEEPQQQQSLRSSDGEGEEEGEEDGAVERRVLALLLAAESSTEEKEASTTAVPALSGGRLWRVHEAGLWIGDEACLRSDTQQWGGVVRFVPLDKEAVVARRQEAQQPEDPPGAIEDIDEGEGRRGEFAREGLPRAIVAFRRYLCAVASSPSEHGRPPFLIVCPTGTAHAPIIAASLLLAHFNETEAGWALRPWPQSREDGGGADEATERPYLPDAYHRDRRLGPLNVRPPLPRLRALPKLTDKDAVRRALGFVQRALGEDGVVPPARALQKELWSLFSGDTSSGSSGV